MGKEEGEAAGRHCDNSGFILCVGVCLFSVDLFRDHFCASRKKFYRPLQWAYSIDIRQKNKTKKKTVLQLNGFTRDSLKEIEDKVTNTHTEGKQ